MASFHTVMEDRKGTNRALYIKILTAFTSVLFLVAAPAAASEDHGPHFSEDSTPDHATTGDPFDFTVQSEGCFPQMVVDVRYYYDDGPVIIEPLGSRGTYPIWSTTINIRSTPGTIHYRFGGFDSTGGWMYTQWKSIPVIDNDPPVLVEYHGAYYATPGDMYKFDVELTDNDMLAIVWVDVWFDDGEPTTLYLSEVGENRFSQDLLVPWTGSTLMHYVLHALDRAGNALEAVRRSIPVEADLTPPSFGEDLSDTEGTTGDEFRLGIIVLGDFGLADVRVEYRFGETPLTYTSLEGELRFRHRVHAPLHSTEMLVYRFYAVDLAGNFNTTEWKNAPITERLGFKRQHRDRELHLVLCDGRCGTLTVGRNARACVPYGGRSKYHPGRSGPCRELRG